MTYVTCDIHGRYGKYMEMLKKINFSDRDDLYVIGDMLDIGDEPIELIRDMSMRINVFPILGDREYMALKMLSGPDLEFENRSPEFIKWLNDGGKTTYDGYYKLSFDEREAFKEYLADLPLYEDINVGGVRYILVHAGLDGFKKDRNLDDYGPHEIIFNKADVSKCYFDGAVLVTGHERVGAQEKALRRNGHLCIDCSGTDEGVLCAVCLDDGREFYV